MKKTNFIATHYARFGALITIAGLSFISGTSAFAASKTVKLAVPGMTCASCPITVKQALVKVQGVEKAQATFEKREAVVTYDDSKTNVEKLMEATRNAGYPSTVKK